MSQESLFPVSSRGDNVRGIVSKLDLGFIGFTLYLAAFFLSLFSPALIILREESYLHSIFSHILFFVGMSAVFACAAIRPKAFVSPKGSRVVFAGPIVISLLFAVFLNLYQVQASIFGVLYSSFCFLEGIAVGIMCLEAALFFTVAYRSHKGERACFYAVFGIVVAAVILALCSASSLSSTVVLVLATLGAQLSLSPLGLLKSDRQYASKPWLPVNSRFKQITLGFTVFGLILGTMAAYRYVPNGLMTNSIWTVALSLSIGAIVFGGIWVLLRERASIFLTQWMLLPVPILGLLLFPLVDEKWRVLINIVLLGCYMCYDIANLLAISNMSNHNKVSCLRMTGTCRAFAMAGTVIGWSLSSYFLSQEYNNSIMASYAITIIFVLLVGLFVVLRPKPETQLSSQAGKWTQRCEKVCEVYHLSPRESEILLLLAKSHNALSIEQKLNISSHTVRTHINHIYAKLGIHCHQELIDLIESQD